MVQAGESSHTRPSSGSGPAPPPAATTGTLVVVVTHRASCWDSTPEGTPAPHEGATVTVSPAGGGSLSARTDANGRARFENVAVGNADVEVNAVNYLRDTQRANVTAGGTAEVTLQLVWGGAGALVHCFRRHSPPPSGTPTVSILPPMFWHDSLMILIREIAWLIFLAAMVAFLIVAILNVALSMHWHASYASFALPVTCFAIVAYLMAILLGQIAGIVTILLAGLSWLALVGITIAGAAGVPGLLPLDFIWFPVLCGTWTSFFFWWPIRMRYSIQGGVPYLFLLPIPAIVVGLVLYFVLVYVPEPNLQNDTVGEVMYAILCVVLCFVFGLLSGLTGHCFGNDGNVDPYTAHDVKGALPFAGSRYCVQGNRGWFSHYASENQERCYDFAVPEGTHVLAIREGHVIEFREDQELSYYAADDVKDSAGHDKAHGRAHSANYIYVQHRDGTVARYLHLKKNGVSEINPALVAASTLSAGVYTSNVHVHAGQILALAGTTGVSRFPHIHMGLYETGRSGQNIGLEFDDADVARHSGRCFTFRQYLSSNPDKGPIVVPS